MNSDIWWNRLRIASMSVTYQKDKAKKKKKEQEE